MLLSSEGRGIPFRGSPDDFKTYGAAGDAVPHRLLPTPHELLGCPTGPDASIAVRRLDAAVLLSRKL